jgi:aminoglycoside phosphotransferase (APT) family kinase protein
MVIGSESIEVDSIATTRRQAGIKGVCGLILWDIRKRDWELFVSTANTTGTERPLLATLHFALFLRESGLGDSKAARRHVAEAIELSPSLTENLEQLITDWAMKQTYHPPPAFVQAVLGNLPGDLVKPGQLQQRALAKIHIAQAFDEHNLGHGAQARRHILRGLRYDPSFLLNRGVIATLAKSFLDHHRSDSKPPHDDCQPDEDVPKSVISQVEAAMGCSVDSVERITSGSSGNRIYLVRSGEQPSILRLLAKDVVEERIAIVERILAAGVPTPAILASDSVSVGHRELSWLLEEWAPGSWFRPSTMSYTDQLSAVADLGQHLRRLHSISAGGFGRISSARLEAPYRTLGAWLDGKQQAISQACFRGAIPETTIWALDAADHLLRETYTGLPVLGHGDLADCNVLVAGGRVSAIIDWESISGTDPAYDIAVFWTDMGYYWYPMQDRSMLDNLLEAYHADEPDGFRHRVVAHRLLLVATEVSGFMDKEDAYHQRYYRIFQSIMANASLVD